MKSQKYSVVYLEKKTAKNVNNLAPPYFSFRLNGRLIALYTQTENMPFLLQHPASKREKLFVQAVNIVFKNAKKDGMTRDLVPIEYVDFINHYLNHLENCRRFFVKRVFTRDQKTIDDYDIELWCKIIHNKKIYCGLEISLWVTAYCAGVSFYESEIFFVSYLRDRSLNKSKNLERLDLDANTISGVTSNQKDDNIKIHLTSSISTKNVDFWIHAIRNK